MDPAHGFFRYLPTYPGIEDWGARVLDAGCTQIGRDVVYPAPGHPDDHHFSWEAGRQLRAWTFVYITAGGGVFESQESGSLPVQSGDVFVIFPGVWHRYRPHLETGWDEYWVECDGKALEDAIQRTGLDPAKPVLRVGHDDALLRCFLDIMETIRLEPPCFQAIVGMQSMVLLAQLRSLLQKVREQGATSSERIARQSIVLMREHLGGQIIWEDVAKKAGVSYSSFRRLFRKTTGRSPGDYFIEMKINRARQLLEIPSNTIQDICNQLGFESVSHFSTLFKARTGSPPSVLRKRSRQSEPGPS
jgi:AraC-like DNA-binding protein